MDRSLAVLALGFALLLAACGDGGSDDGTRRIAVIPKGTTHEFWKAIHAGAAKAAAELEDVEIVWRGPEKEDDREAQINLVQNFVASEVDAIVLAPLDDHALVQPVRLATRSGIPVVIIDSGLGAEIGTDFVSFVATDNEKGGRLAGEELARLVGGRGKVLILRYQEGSASTLAREKGFLEAMVTHPEITVLDPHRYAGATRGTARETAENLLGTLEGLAGVFCSNESATYGMLLALRAHELAGKLRFVGFDASPGLVEALRAGELDALVVQDPLRMGYEGVRTAVAKLEGRAFAAQIDTGVHLVTTQNMDTPEMAELLAPELSRYLDR